MSYNVKEENELIKSFQMQPDEEKFGKLYDTFEGALEKRINDAGALKSNIPRPAIKGQALKLFDKALHSFQPGKVKFTTWLHTQTQPLGRYVRDHSDIGHIPDNRAMKLARFKERDMFLQDELGREPTTQELAQDLKWSPKKVALTRKELRKDLRAEGGLESIGETNDLEIVEDRARALKIDLDEKQQLIMDHLLGLDGRKKLTVNQIADKLKMEPTKVRYQQGKIQKMWQDYYGSK